jgi:PAS domain S-box-containing protein
LVHYAQALICTYDLNGTIISVNPALATLLGRSAAELLGQPVADNLLAEDQETVSAHLARMATEGEAEGVVRVRLHASQEIRYLLSRNFVVRQPGQAPYVVSHSHDITDRVRAEQELKRARQEAEATARARENFLANMSHEIRTPMNGVLGMTAQLAKTRLDTRQQELVRIIRSSGQHLLAVLNDVLEMAKITAGKLELEQAPFNLCHSMEAAVQPLALQAQEKGLEVVGVPLRDSCPVPWIIGDAHRLNQILINLVSNAVKFTARGRITIKGEMLDETEDTLTVRFSVQDTGPGIAPEKQAHIFESFTQAYADTARQHGGTGLGLTISRGLVEQMGGQLTLVSEVGQGSTFAFTLTLPKAPAEALPVDPEAVGTTGQLAGVRVLLVEDNDINRTVARMMLEPWGVVLAEAPDGPAALALLEQQTYDVVLMDIQMPGMSGVEVTQRLRKLPLTERAATPVIALTANAFRADLERYLTAGFNDYLAKPFDEEELYHKITALLGRAVTRAYDLTQLLNLAKGRTVFVERIVRSFLANMPGKMQELRAAAATSDWPEVAHIVHHIKPNLLALAVTGIAEPLALLERAHRTAALEEEQPPAESLQRALKQLLNSIEQALRELPAELSATGS